MKQNIPTTYNFPDHYKGDTFNGMQFTLKDTVSEDAIDLTDVLIYIQFRRGSKIGQIVKDLSIGQGITLTDAINGIFRIDPFINNWAVSIYFYDVQMKFANEVIRTYVTGTQNLVQDVTVPTI